MLRVRIVFCLCLLLCCLNENVPAEAKTLQRLNFGVSDNQVISLTAHPHIHGEVWIGTSQELYQSIDNGQTFQLRYRIPQRMKDVQFIHIPVEDPGHIYISNRRDIYFSEDDGFNWQTMSAHKFLKYKWIYAMTSYQQSLFLATDRGILFREDHRADWRWLEPGSLNEPVHHLLVMGQFLFAATKQKVYRIALGPQQKVNLVLEIDRPYHPPEETANPVEAGEDEYSRIRFIRPLLFVGRKQAGHNVSVPLVILLATQDRIYYQNIKQGDWHELSVPCHQLGEINDMIFFTFTDEIETQTYSTGPSALNIELFGLAGTNRGVFRLQAGYWTPNDFGLDRIRVLRLLYNRLDTVFYGTDDGVYSSALKEIFPDHFQQGFMKPKISYHQFLEEQWSREPTIATVQSWAVRYADVHPDKILKWKKRALQQAWLPQFSLGADIDKNRTLSDSIWGSYSGGGQHYSGPDDKTFYSNLGIGLNFSWDLGDMLWSTDLTAIDSRAKLNVELREDLLNQVTRLYFERRRVQLDLLKEEVYEFYSEDDKELRLAEITALLDAYTGGQFTNALEQE